MASSIERLGYTVQETTQIYPFCRATVYNLIRNGTLKSIKVGAKRIILASSLDELAGGGARVQ